MNLKKIRKFLYTLDPQEYIDFMKEVHFHCPFKTNELTEKIIYSWKTDKSMESRQFYEIIRDRQVAHEDEAQEKREEDFQQIQDRKCKTGLEPLQLFPKEIWMKLLDQVQPEDKRNFRDVHETFRHLTEDTLIRDILFPMILGFKVERFWGESEAENPNEDEDVPQKPLVCPLAQYTQLRLVSKSMRNAVDRWFEDDIISNLRNGEKKSQPSGVIGFNLTTTSNDAVDYRRIKKMKEDLSDLSSPKPKRFFTRSLSLFSEEELREWRFDDDNGVDDGWVNKRAQLEELTGNIDDILDLVGDQIWYFSFVFQSTYFHSPGSLEFSKRYTSFLGWLGKMPNLKWLRICLAPHEKDYESAYKFPEGLVPHTLIHLERLDLELEELSKYVMPVYYQFLHANPHVKILGAIQKYVLKERNGFLKSPLLKPEALGFNGWTGAPYGRSKIWSMGDPDNLHDFDSDDDDEDDKDKDKFDDMILTKSIANDTQWPLRKIDWTVDCDETVYSVFQSLEKLQTLEEIRLYIQDIRIPTEEIGFLKLPKLTHFELKFDHPHYGRNLCFFFNLQFLLYVKKLRSLAWKCDMHEDIWRQMIHDVEKVVYQGEMIEFEGGLRDFTDSNIWLIFPSLDTISCELIFRGGVCGDLGKKSISDVHRRRDIDFY